ncbi:MAG: hypothetical protein AB7O88_23395 [Reyranellaceae bacterium]
MTITTTCFFLKNVHPAAGPYYLQFPSEPIPPAGSGEYLAVAPPIALADNMATTALAAIAAKVKKNGSVLLVCHGTDKNLKLQIGLGEDDVLQADALRFLRENVENKLDDAEAARRLKFADAKAGDPTGVGRLNALKAAMAQVHALQLHRVDLRACNIGKTVDTLERLQWFFNADICCAPDSWDAFGPLPSPTYTRNPADWRDFLKKHPTNSMIDDGTKRYALGYTLGGRTILQAMATSPDALEPWVKKFLPPKPTTTGVAVAYHGLTKDMKQLIFAGEAEYRERLVSVTTGKGSTTIKVNPTAPLPSPRQLP